MIQTAICIIAKILLIFVMLTAIVFLIGIIFAVMSAIKDIHNQNKIKSKTLKNLEGNFHKMIVDLDSETNADEKL